ncbi:MAG TPA: hypothetical protein VG308_15975 [Stellaceae bacterium]|jgi:hypothetical protein|nr:hypothetical protein [Stellaceae bacterium]
MKTVLAATAAIALIAAAAAPASAQMYRTTTTMGAPSWMTDDGSSSDFPIHNPGDISGERLNAQYGGGMTVPPGQGLPGYPGQR